MEIGGDPGRFWAITPREIRRETKAMAAIKREDHDKTAWLAWHIAVLTRMDHKKFPPLEKMLSRKRQQTREEIEANLKAIFGYPGKDA